MTKKELLDLLKDVPDESEVDVYDLGDYTHPKFTINTTDFNYDAGLPIVTIEIERD